MFESCCLFQMHEPTSMPFASDSALAYPQFPQPEWAQMQAGLSCNIEEPSMGNAREHALKKTINEHLAPAEGCGDANSQVPYITLVQPCCSKCISSYLY